MPDLRLPRSFYARDASIVARESLGKILVRRIGDRRLRARIIETEAYIGAHDLACHASKGRTKRTEVMFGPPGYAYVYLVYGMHHMLNLVTGEEGDPQAVLIRAAEPVGGKCLASLPNGHGNPGARAADSEPSGSLHEGGRLASANLSGPGRLTRAMEITVGENGADLCSDEIYLAEGRPPESVVVGPRIGVDYAGEWADAPLRFHEEGNTGISSRRKSSGS